MEYVLIHLYNFQWSEWLEVEFFVEKGEFNYFLLRNNPFGG